MNGSQRYGQLFDIIELTVLNFKPSPSGGNADGSRQCLQNVLVKKKRGIYSFWEKIQEHVYLIYLPLIKPKNN